LLLDYFTGPFVSLTALFVVPVALAARHDGRFWGTALGITMPLAHFAFILHWSAPWSLLDSGINLAVRMVALVGFALLIDGITRQERELRILRGLLPICAFCKKIRTRDQTWQQIELYISEHSQARFTHSICPQCSTAHYPELFATANERPEPSHASADGRRPDAGTREKVILIPAGVCPQEMPITKDPGTSYLRAHQPPVSSQDLALRAAILPRSAYGESIYLGTSAGHVPLLPVCSRQGLWVWVVRFDEFPAGVESTSRYWGDHAIIGAT